MKITRTFFLLVSLGSGIALSAHAQPGVWQTYTGKADRFTAEFSGPVSVKSAPVGQASKDRKIVKSTVYTQKNVSSYYVVVATLNKKRVNFEFAVRSIRNLSDCATVSNDTKPRRRSAQYREVSGKGCMGGKYDIGNVFYGSGKWFYQASYVIPSGSNKKEAERFLHSFKLL